MARNIEFDVLAHDRASDTFDKVGRAAERTHGILSKIGRGAALALGGAATAVATFGAAGVTMGIKTAAANEQASIAFTTMLGSAQKAQSFLSKLQAFAAATPFEFPELQTAASSLISAGINANKVIPIMRTLGDVTSGMGTGSEGVQRATVALQQMSAAGKITGEDLNQLRDAGIPVYDLLAKATGKSKDKVVELAQAGKLGKKELGQMMAALESGKGLERFAGLMDKQSQSLTGLWSTFKDTLGQGLATAIQPAIPLIKDGLGKGIELISANMPKAAAAVKEFTGGIRAFSAAWRANDGDVTSSGFAGSMERLANTLHKVDFTPVTSAFARLKSVDLSTVMNKLTSAFHQLAPAAGDMGRTLPALGPSMHVFGQAVSFAADHVDLLRKAMPFLIAAFAAYKAAQLANRTIGRDSLVGFAVQTGATLTMAAANFALARSMRATAAAGAQSVAAENLGTISRIRGTVATVASAVAQRVAAGAAKVFAAAQWLINAALSANPIGLVIVAIAALAAGLVYAYKHSQTFRNIVNGALQAVGRVGIWLWNSVFQPVIHFIVAGFASIAAGIGHMLVALGRVPGFGWAKTAGQMMLGAAQKAQTLANNIRKIPDKHVTITVSTHVMAGRIKVGNQYVNVGQFASGTPKAPKGWAWVGEQGPELMNLRGGEQIIPAKQSAAIASAKSVPPSVGGDQTLTVNFWLDGKVVQQSLLKLKREGGTELGLA